MSRRRPSQFQIALTRIGIALMRLLTRLPLPWQHRLGRWLGRLGWLLAARRRHVVLTNLRCCFPAQDRAARHRLARDHFESLGQAMFETARAWFGPPPAFDATNIPPWLTVQGLDSLHAALREGNGVILLGLHFDSLDLVGTYLARLVPVDVMYRKHKNTAFDAVMHAGRNSHFGAMIERRDLKQMIRRLRGGHIVWYAPDQDYGRKHAMFVPFFATPAATLTTTSRLARATGARVIGFAHYRLGDGRYGICLQPFDDFPGDDVEADTRRINAWYETAILRHPEQYWWVHRRFKTRPEGEPPLY